MNFKSALKPIWCPGCGDFGVLQALYRALTAVGRPPHEIAFVSGIGCSSRIPGYTTAYGFNSIHGRALPIAQGIKIANPELLVLVAGGDGDGFSIGGGHVPHAVRRNVDLTYIVMDNQIYGLTKGQLSPTSRQGLRTVTSVTGSIEQPFNPLLAVLAYGAPLRRAGDAGGHGRAVLHDRGGDPVPRLRVRERAVAVRDLRRPRLAVEGPQGGDGEGRPTADTIRPTASAPWTLAQGYGRELVTGVLYRDPEPPPTYESLVRERQDAVRVDATARARVLESLRGAAGGGSVMNPRGSRRS